MQERLNDETDSDDVSADEEIGNELEIISHADEILASEDSVQENLKKTETDFQRAALMKQCPKIEKVSGQYSIAKENKKVVQLTDSLTKC